MQVDTQRKLRKTSFLCMIIEISNTTVEKEVWLFVENPISCKTVSARDGLFIYSRNPSKIHLQNT